MESPRNYDNYLLEVSLLFEPDYARSAYQFSRDIYPHILVLRFGKTSQIISGQITFLEVGPKSDNVINRRRLVMTDSEARASVGHREIASVTSESSDCLLLSNQSYLETTQILRHLHARQGCGGIRSVLHNVHATLAVCLCD